MKKQRVQHLANLGVLSRFHRGGKNSNFGKKGAIFKVSVCNENKDIFNLARSKIAVLGLQKKHSKTRFVLVRRFQVPLWQ